MFRNLLRLLSTLVLAMTSIALLTSVTNAQSRKPITGGYVLTHEHPTNPMAFGGNYAFTGKDGNYSNGVMIEGYTKMVPGCPTGQLCSYGMFRGLLAGELALGGDMGVHGPHWGPKQNAFAHARYSTEWIKELWSPPEKKYQDTSLKVLVALAVENYSMCETLYYANKGLGGPGGNGYACSRGDSIKSNERQIDALKAWVAENKDWMQIAYTPRQARRIANSGKLVVILGIESDYDFGAEDRTFDPVDRLNRYYDMGVRTFYLAHKLNSRLAGADIFQPGHTLAGKAIRANQAMAGCFFYDDAVDNFPLKNNQGHSFCDNNCGDGAFKGNKLFGLLDNCNYRPSEISEFNTTDYIMTRGNTTFNGFKIYPKTPGFEGSGGSYEDKKTHAPIIVERNNLGLSHDGERVVRAAMLKGMIVNIDHVSSRARIDVRRISRDFADYPLNALHNNPNSLLEPDKKPLSPNRYLHEYEFDDSELEIIRETGGFFGVRVGPLDAKPYPNSGVNVDCPKTITETAQVLAYLLDKGLPVGYSLDYATITKGVYSRTAKGNKQCRDFATDHMHTYKDQKSGATFTTEGLAHAGVMQQWHKELEAIGLKNKYLKQLRNDGPERFIQMWENAHRKRNKGEQIERRIFALNPPPDVGCKNDNECGNGRFCSKGLLPGIGPSKCVDERKIGGVCTQGRHCDSGRCGAGFCAKAHQCNRDTDCSSNQFCKTPVGVAEARICAAKLNVGAACLKSSVCSSGRCAAGFCAKAHACDTDSDCGSSKFCKTPVGIGEARICEAKLSNGKACVKSSVCASGRCAAGLCAKAHACDKDSDCGSGKYCKTPAGIAEARVCKSKLAQGKLCTKGSQCSSNCCKPHISTGGLPSCRPASKC